MARVEVKRDVVARDRGWSVGGIVMEKPLIQTLDPEVDNLRG
jgi:hypothetical protein